MKIAFIECYNHIISFDTRKIHLVVNTTDLKIRHNFSAGMLHIGCPWENAQVFNYFDHQL